jgi:hypothetical protein
MVLDLAETPPEDKLFHIYMDNYFTSVPLFQALRRRGISAARTTRQDANGYPKEFTEAKKKKVNLEWNTLKAKLVLAMREHMAKVGDKLDSGNSAQVVVDYWRQQELSDSADDMPADERLLVEKAISSRHVHRSSP